jgi:hypothetical protein
VANTTCRGNSEENSAKMDRFNTALRQVMQVSKEDLKEILAQEKAANANKPKRGPKPVSTS